MNQSKDKMSDVLNIIIDGQYDLLRNCYVINTDLVFYWYIFNLHHTQKKEPRRLIDLETGPLRDVMTLRLHGS